MIVQSACWFAFYVRGLLSFCLCNPTVNLSVLIVLFVVLFSFLGFAGVCKSVQGGVTLTCFEIPGNYLGEL